MRKNIDLPSPIVVILDKLAGQDGRKTKNYIEKVLIDHAQTTPLKKISAKIKSK